MKEQFCQALIQLFERDIDKMIRELESYNKETDVWKIHPGTLNSGGTLAWHIGGNLHHFIGGVLGETGYMRDRPGEFGDRNISRNQLIKKLENGKSLVKQVLPMLTKEQLQSDYPIEVFGKPMSTMFFLIHLHSHLNYHRGQMNYHRRVES